MGELVRAVVGAYEVNVSRSAAFAKGWTVLEDVSPYNEDGTPRKPTRRGGRPTKPRTTVAKKAAEKKAVTESAENEGVDQ